MKTTPIAILAGVAAVLIVGYQQCSPVNFQSSIASSNLKPTGNVDSNDGKTPSDEPTTSGDGTASSDGAGTQMPGDDHGNQNPTGECIKISEKNTSVEQDGQNTIVRTPCPGESDKSCVVICHVPPGNPAAKHTIIIGEPARKAHIIGGGRGHGTDYDGPCGEFVPENETACVYK